jgi:Serine acetyltransferase
LRHYTFKYGITIPYKTKIGHCFNIAHFSGIFISDAAIIGNNVVVSQGVTIGSTRTGVPKIGDNVYMGAGAKVIGGIVVGNNVAIGANCVVAKDIPDNAVVMGYPCKVVSYKGNDHT